MIFIANGKQDGKVAESKRGKKLFRTHIPFYSISFFAAVAFCLFLFTLVQNVYIMRLLFFLMGRNLKLSTNSEWEKSTEHTNTLAFFSNGKRVSERSEGHFKH